MRIDDSLRVVPDLADATRPSRSARPTSSPLRHGVRFHDGHELTSADVVYTFRQLPRPDVRLRPQGRLSRCSQSVDARRPLHRRVHAEGAVRLVSRQPRDAGIVPDGAGAALARPPDRHGPVPLRRVRGRRPRRARARSTATTAGRRSNDGARRSRSCPTTSCAASSCARARSTSSSTTCRPTSCTSSRATAGCSRDQSPGIDYQYIGLNLRDPVLADVRVRQALGYAIDRQAIVDVPAPRPRRAGRRHPAAAVVGVRARRVPLHVRPGEGARACSTRPATPIPTATARAPAAR